MKTDKPEEIVKALEKGPLTYKLLSIALGYGRCAWGAWPWWQWRRKGRAMRESAEIDAVLKGTLQDMVTARQIEFDDKAGLYSLPSNRCQHCNGTGRANGPAGGPYR